MTEPLLDEPASPEPTSPRRMVTEPKSTGPTVAGPTATGPTVAGPLSFTVVIVDDHSIFRSGLRADLGPQVQVVGEAANVDDAVARIAELKPQVVLLDVHLPGGEGGGGAEVIRRSADLLDGTRFLALSVSDSAEDVVGVIRAGARGYITKGSSGVEVSSAVEKVAGGDAVFSPKLAGFVLDAFGAVSGEQAEASDELDRLSAREREVMRLIARGFAYKEVASDLFISIKTVETHVSAVLRKLQLSSRHELTAWALERKLL
jgi:DNA-binding NarL/FixJ family response regulator